MSDLGLFQHRLNNVTHSIVGTELVRKLAETGLRVFTTEKAREYASAVGLTPGYFRQAMHYLARSGWIVRLKNGLYSLSSTVPGVSSLHEYEIAMVLVKPAAVSHWSAFHHHGLTQQIPRRVFVLTTARAVPRLRGRRARSLKDGYPVFKTIYQFVQVKPDRYFGIEDTWVNEAKIKITDLERTLLDGLMMPQYCGDFSEVLHAFELSIDKINLDKIVNYGLKMDAAIAKRLGWVLQNQGVELSRIESLHTIPIKGYRVLDPSGPHRGPCNKHWMIQVNTRRIS